ncbi:hypothetical protein M0811_06588 [Anaeramoeba ignava]|uniref:Uncharacterized protein n=1 Tax=Anaeramoeba ignava TaxID=1746090 RepID=A0A9Q0LLK7_ANAIG|nr:hypothetical protein M0811_06588 [Anaeramoeba ignava]
MKRKINKKNKRTKIPEYHNLELNLNLFYSCYNYNSILLLLFLLVWKTKTIVLSFVTPGSPQFIQIFGIIAFLALSFLIGLYTNRLVSYVVHSIVKKN